MTSCEFAEENTTLQQDQQLHDNMIDVLGSKNPMKEKKLTQDWFYKNNSVILIKVRFELYRRPFDLKAFFPGADLPTSNKPKELSGPRNQDDDR